MQTKKVLGWIALIVVGGFWLGGHWSDPNRGFHPKESSSSLPSVLMQAASADQTHVADDEDLAAKKEALADADFLRKQRDVLRLNPPIGVEFSGTWGIVSDSMNVPELHLKVGETQDFMITSLMRTVPKAYMSFVVSGQIVPCGAQRIAVHFGNGEMFALHNMKHFCPQGFVIFQSEESHASRISAALNANRAPPIAVSYGTSSFYLSRVVHPEDMALLLHAVNTCAPYKRCNENESVRP